MYFKFIYKLIDINTKLSNKANYMTESRNEDKTELKETKHR